jgi:uncharacterized protein with beta-barrel porin domain
MFGGLTPYAAVQAQNFRTPSYSETDVNGGGFALAYNSRTGTDTRSELGARFDRLLAINPNAAPCATRGEADVRRAAFGVGRANHLRAHDQRFG